MPRAKNPANEAHQRRQARYRACLVSARTPEAPAVDAAVAGAVAAYAAAIRGRKAGAETSPAQVVGGILAAAVRLLVAGGYDEDRALRVAERRLSRGCDARRMDVLVARAGLSDCPARVRPTKRRVLRRKSAMEATGATA